MKARLLESHEIAPNTRHFEFESDDWKPVFEPGQFLSFTWNEITRAYSIASAPGGERFALCANLVEDGHFSPHLFDIQPGDEVDFKGPYGAFTLRRTHPDSIFVATGTGIAPFRSMLHAHLPEGGKITLIFGVRYEHGLLYHEEWLNLAERYPSFDYRPTPTRPYDDWTGRRGRVQQHVLEAVGEQCDVNIYMCGMREMVDDLRAQLKAIGVDRRQMIYEKYD